MSAPSNIYLAPSAKFFGFLDPKKAYNSHWDIVWSFTYALTGTQHGFCTYLSNSEILLSSLPGQYLGYLYNVYGTYDYLLSEDSEIISTEGGESILYDDLSASTYINSGFLGIAFDSTGYFALSNSYNDGVSVNGVKKNSLIIRQGKNLIFNEALSALDTSFFLSSSVKSYQTLRFRLSNGNKLYIDYRNANTEYKNLTTVKLSNLDIANNTALYPAFAFSSPISSVSITPSTLWFKNFHTQGCVSDPTYETLDYQPITPHSNTYTTISGITAIPV